MWQCLFGCVLNVMGSNQGGNWRGQTTKTGNYFLRSYLSGITMSCYFGKLYCVCIKSIALGNYSVCHANITHYRLHQFRVLIWNIFSTKNTDLSVILHVYIYCNSFLQPAVFAIKKDHTVECKLN